MKKICLALILLGGLHASAQESTPATPIPATTTETPELTMHHEIGINATLLMKQVLSLSSINAVVLPYDLTYKYITNNKWAFRTGIGLNTTNSTSETTTSTTSTTTAGPDAPAPNISKSFDISYRAGIECRHQFTKWLVGYAGVDLAGSNSKSTSQNSQTFNNLPWSYNYTRTSDVTSAMGIGGGPVLGVQFYVGKRLSFYTEVPIYFIHSSSTENIDNYRNDLQGSNNYVSSTNTQTQTVTGSSWRITIPATVYLAIRF